MLNIKEEVEFREWPKIPRGQHEQVTVTEKMDGTNACIVIEGGEIISIQSRKKRISPAALSGEKDSDNMGFAAWVAENVEDLLSLEDGYHYGEWAGPGIQKNPHALLSKQFYLFNTFRWNEDNPNKPACCAVVPVLYHGDFTENVVEEVMDDLLQKSDSLVKHEGVVVYFHKTRRYEKHTFKDQKGKWANVSFD